MPSLSIEAANKKVCELIANPLESLSEQEVHPSQSKTKRKQYLILDPAQRYEIGKRASLRYYAWKYPEVALKKLPYEGPTTVKLLSIIFFTATACVS